MTDYPQKSGRAGRTGLTREFVVMPEFWTARDRQEKKLFGYKLEPAAIEILTA
jgi:hypothetical protein